MPGDECGGQGNHPGHPDLPHGGGHAPVLLGRRFSVSGKVQGVWFRESTRQQAVRLGLVGHAKNLPDGSVACIAVAKPESMKRFRLALKEGPRFGLVTLIEEERLTPAESEGYTGFQITH